MLGESAQNPPRSAAVQLFESPPNVPQTVRFLGPYLGAIFHWHANRSWPCPGPAECPNTIHRARSVWKGFAPAERWCETSRLWFPGVQGVTEALEELLRGRTLRGEVWLLTRIQEGRKAGPLRGVYCERQQEGVLSPCWDILPVLLRLLHVDKLLLGVPNPMPAKLVIEPTAGPAPHLPPELLPAPQATLSEQEKKQFSEQLKGLKSRGGSAGEAGDRPPSSNGRRPPAGN